MRSVGLVHEQIKAHNIMIAKVPENIPRSM